MMRRKRLTNVNSPAGCRSLVAAVRSARRLSLATGTRSRPGSRPSALSRSRPCRPTKVITAMEASSLQGYVGAPEIFSKNGYEEQFQAKQSAISQVASHNWDRKQRVRSLAGTVRRARTSRCRPLRLLPSAVCGAARYTVPSGRPTTAAAPDTTGTDPTGLILPSSHIHQCRLCKKRTMVGEDSCLERPLYQENQQSAPPTVRRRRCPRVRTRTMSVRWSRRRHHGVRHPRPVGAPRSGGPVSVQAAPPAVAPRTRSRRTARKMMMRNSPAGVYRVLSTG